MDYYVGTLKLGTHKRFLPSVNFTPNIARKRSILVLQSGDIWHDLDKDEEELEFKFSELKTEPRLQNSFVH